MKLLQDSKALHAEEFSNASPYIIMFGPDKCGSTNKVLIPEVTRNASRLPKLPGPLHISTQESQNRGI